MPVVLEQEKVVKLPIFCHSVIDDLPMSLEAFRMYAHLARKWGNGKFGALGSYVDMGEHCYRQAFPKASSETLRRKAISAVRELQELNLLHKETRQGHDGRNLANSYILHDLKVIVSSHQGRCDDTRVVRMHPPSEIAPLEDTNSKDPPKEDSLPLTPSHSSGVRGREREDKTEDKRTGTKPHPLAADRDQLELLGKEDQTTESSATPLALVPQKPELSGFEPTNSGQDSDSAASSYLEQKYSFNNSNPPAPNPTYPDSRSLELSEKEPPTLSSGSSGRKAAASPINEKQDSDCASVCQSENPPEPTPIYRDRVAERFNRTAALQDWEIRPGVPYPAFVKWRSQHYIKQGGHWADAALANAKSEIRNNPQRAADLWSQFLEYSNTAADNALAHQAQGMTPTLPSCFADSQPPTRGEVIAKLEALVGVAQVALPQGVATPSCTATIPYMPDSPTRVSSNAGYVVPVPKIFNANRQPLENGCPTFPSFVPRPYPAAISSSASAASEPTVGILVAGKQAAVSTPLGTETPGTQTIAGEQVRGCAGESVQKDSLCEQFPPAHLQPGPPASADLEWDTQQQEQNMHRLAQMIRSIKSMPKPHKEQPQPTNHFEKMRSWLQSDEPALRSEAIAWLYKCQDVEPVFDEYGNPYDFTEIEF